MMRTCVRTGKIQPHAAHSVRTHVRIKTAKKRFVQKINPQKTDTDCYRFVTLSESEKPYFTRVSGNKKQTF